MAKKTTKTTKQVQPKDLKVILEQLERIEHIVRQIFENTSATPIQITAEETGKVEEVKQHLINQKGETVELTYDSVRVEAQKLVSKDEHTEQKGFAKAREIIIGYGVTKLEEVAKENYSEIVSKFRKALSEWK